MTGVICSPSLLSLTRTGDPNEEGPATTCATYSGSFGVAGIVDRNVSAITTVNAFIAALRAGRPVFLQGKTRQIDDVPPAPLVASVPPALEFDKDIEKRFQPQVRVSANLRANRFVLFTSLRQQDIDLQIRRSGQVKDQCHFSR